MSERSYVLVGGHMAGKVITLREPRDFIASPVFPACSVILSEDDGPRECVFEREYYELRRISTADKIVEYYALSSMTDYETLCHLLITYSEKSV